MEWETFSKSRKESARLWADLVKRHHRLRCLHWTWPSKGRWERWAQGRYPLLDAQSVQQTIGEFMDAVESTVELRKSQKEQGLEPTARFPWKTSDYRDVVYTNQAAKIRNGHIVLPHGKLLGKVGRLRVKIPKGLELPGRLMEARLMFGRLLLVCQAATSAAIAGPSASPILPAAGDLGVNTLLAVTNGEKTLLISGREVKATVQWRNKRLASIQASRSRKTKGSRRDKRLQRRKFKMLNKARNRAKDATHKAARLAADAFPGAAIFVGEPFNDAARKMGRVQAQQVSSACNGQIIRLLDYKMAGATVVPEHYSSQTCPVCGCRNKCRRTYKCQQCGFTAPRDVVGSSNILSIGTQGTMRPNPDFKTPKVTWRHPSKYPGKGRRCIRGQVVPAEPRQVARR